ncbi:FAD-binding protein [Azospirillum sp. RWY-5-1]|uniref:D-lactate dehydrogenase (cytochrome) n=1 Tax=Azospirillum oleiclasticum TaxID=2735135 RepID=A0ABX2TC91_9PROT|nr:FAD-linked oxidase C-terminal domain-containing protein [Azospirillum oleiclasticum]NYZ13948.1 FAD-binding protein [Azospirillum oleiclasticum]NYZ20871.1 FAD-binding protein [Azospirillum oleiclasticum]
MSPIQPPPDRTPLAPDTLHRLAAIVGGKVSTRPADLTVHGQGECYHPSMPPDVVCFPGTTAEVAAVVKLARETGTPIVPFGAGTSLEGHTAAMRGGICIDLGRMNVILDVRPEDMDVTVQAGVTRKQLNSHIRDTGLFFPVDPGADATLGGMAATRASGTNAVRYGTMRENVLALTVVLPDGSIVKTANRARKSSAGYDLTRLFVGSEGTLGVITEVTLRLHGIPEAVTAAVCSFPDAASAVTTAIQVIQSGIPVARVEFVDAVGIVAVNRFAGLDYPETPALFFEFHGSDAGVREQAARTGEIAVENGGSAFAWAAGAEERSRLWQARHDFHYAVMALRPGARIWGTDVCVPISRLVECIGLARSDAAAAPFPVAALGHVGDGNFHMSYVIDPDSAAERRMAEEFSTRLGLHAIALGGTCTGEHGIGYGKVKFMVPEFGEEAVALMRTLKSAIDPAGLFNPGKIIPPA